MSFTEPRLCALVAMARRITWKFSFGIPKDSARDFLFQGETPSSGFHKPIIVRVPWIGYSELNPALERNHAGRAVAAQTDAEEPRGW